MQRNEQNYVGRHAIVIGSSLAGLLAARVLSDSFERVTLFERDEFPAPGEPRKGVPQGRHAHGLLTRGWRIMQRLFPDFESELLAAGAQIGDSTLDGLWFQQGGYLAAVNGHLPVATLSRPLLEAKLRARVLNLKEIQVRSAATVRELLSPDRQRVTGVRFETEAGVEDLAADLVVDASGRGSHSPAWLEALGYAKPNSSEIKIDLSYTSRTYARHPTELGGHTHLIVVAKAPEQKRGGVLLAQEHNQWIVTLIGMLGDHCPSDEPGFLEFAKSLPTRDLYDVIAQAEPRSEIRSFRYPSSLRRHYERLVRFPSGYVVLGDALCSFNPVFGQGMTVAALEAEALETSLNGGLSGLWQRFIARATRIIDIPWTLAASADLAYPEVPGKRSPQVKLINAYVGKLLEAARADPQLVVAFHQVSNLMKPPSSLFAPSIVRRVLFGSKTQVTRFDSRRTEMAAR